MDKTKTFKKSKKSMVINEIKFTKHDPSLIFKNQEEIKVALFEALFDGDKEAFVDILSGYKKNNPNNY